MDQLLTGSLFRLIARSIMLTVVLLPCVMATDREQIDTGINDGVAISPRSPPCPSFDWNVPSDIILIIDTSESFGKKRFIQTKDFFRDLLGITAVLRPSFSRIAVLTFANETSTVMDFISGVTNQTAECELFSPGGLWDNKLVYMKKPGEKIADALEVALTLLSEGRQKREVTKQRVWLATDMKKMLNAEDSAIANHLDALKQKAEFFGIGLGKYHRAKQIQRFQGYVSAPSACYYHSREEWNVIKTDFTKPESKQGGSSGDWITYVDQDVAGCDCLGLCQCREFTGRLGNTQTRCVGSMLAKDTHTSEDTEDTKEKVPLNWTIIGVGTGVGTLFIVALVIAIICCCLHLKKKSQRRTTTLPKLHENMSTNTEPQCSSDQCSTRTDIGMGTDASHNGSAHLAVQCDPGLSEEHLYVNDLEPKKIQAHTADRRQPTGPSPSLPPRESSNKARSNRPPPVPIPLPDSYAVHRQPLSPDYVEVLDENWHTFPLTARQQSGTYAHVEMNHSRQQSRVSSIQTDDNGYLNMQGGTIAQQLKQTTDNHSIAASIWQNFSSISSKTPKQINGHSNTVPNPKSEKNATNRKYKQNGEAQNSGSDIQPKRNSIKVGTVRFKTLLAKFSNNVNDADEQVARQSSRLDKL